MNISRDLADHSHLVSDIFVWPTSPEEWEQYKLSDEQVAFFNENGYLHNVKLLEEWQVDRLREELVQIMNPNYEKHDLLYEFHSNESTDPDKVIFHCLGHWRLTDGLHDVNWNPAFVMAAYQLLGEKAVRFWHDQLFVKPKKHGGVVAWHQDYSYWTRTVPMQHLTCWVGLDDATLENGCLHYIPGSHKWGLLDKPVLTGAMNELKNYLTEEQKMKFDPVPVEMKKGYAAFHHPLTIHGSFENASERPRRAFVLNAFADGTLSNSDEEMLVGVPHVKKGEKMEGKFFPLLFDGIG